MAQLTTNERKICILLCGLLPSSLSCKPRNEGHLKPRGSQSLKRCIDSADFLCDLFSSDRPALGPICKFIFIQEAPPQKKNQYGRNRRPCRSLDFPILADIVLFRCLSWSSGLSSSFARRRRSPWSQLINILSFYFALFSALRRLRKYADVEGWTKGNHSANREHWASNGGNGDGYLGFTCPFLCDPQQRLPGWQHTTKVYYKTYVRSILFGLSFVVIGALEWSHGQNESASKFLGHPVTPKKIEGIHGP